MKEKDLIEYIHKYFTFNKDGSFSRTDRRNSLGSLDKDGYRIVKIKGKQYKLHRLVFAYFNNRLPNKEIDHINRIRTDNRIENLREVSRAENIANTTRKPNKKTGVAGIHFDTTKGLKKNFAFSVNRKTYRFSNLEEAIAAKEKIMREQYGSI